MLGRAACCRDLLEQFSVVLQKPRDDLGGAMKSEGHSHTLSEEKQRFRGAKPPG